MPTYIYYCSYINCPTSSSSKHKRMYRFPKEEERCKLWIAAAKNPRLYGKAAVTLNKNARLCDTHFADWCFLNKNDKSRLVFNATPDAEVKPTPSSEVNTTVSPGVSNNMKMELRTNICSILESVSEKAVNDIITAVETAGLESLQDLQFVKEEDLALVLNPIYCRKLVKIWTEQIPENDYDSLQSQKFRWKRQRPHKLLEAYAKYKIGFSYPGIEEQQVWRKIAKEMREKYSYKCNELQCRSKIGELKRWYENTKNQFVVAADITDILEKAKIAFEYPVQVNSLDELLKANIRCILNSVSDETVCDIVGALTHASVKSLSDLQFVKDEDLSLFLRPIQRRKLIKAWSEPVVPVVELHNIKCELKCNIKCEPKCDIKCEPKFKWVWKRRLALLRLYTIHKAEFSSQNDQSVWEKIAAELKKASLAFKNCNALECQNQIDYMKCAYKKERKSNPTTRKEAIFLDEARLAFETLKDPISLSELAWLKNGLNHENLQTWTGFNRHQLLEVYAKYKAELIRPDCDENHRVWGKISKEVTEKCSLFYGISRCRFELNFKHKRSKKNRKRKRHLHNIFKDDPEDFETAESPESDAENELEEEVRTIKKEPLEPENGNAELRRKWFSAENNFVIGIKREIGESEESNAEISQKKAKGQNEANSIEGGIFIKQEIIEFEEPFS